MTNPRELRNFEAFDFFIHRLRTFHEILFCRFSKQNHNFPCVFVTFTNHLIQKHRKKFVIKTSWIFHMLWTFTNSNFLSKFHEFSANFHLQPVHYSAHFSYSPPISSLMSSNELQLPICKANGSQKTSKGHKIGDSICVRKRTYW